MGVVAPGEKKTCSNIDPSISNDQQMHNYFTNYHTLTCFDIIVSF